VRTAGNPAALGKRLAAQVAAVDPDLAVSGIQTMDEVAAAMTQRKESMYLVSGFAALALVLAVIGLCGAPMAWRIPISAVRCATG